MDNIIPFPFTDERDDLCLDQSLMERFMKPILEEDPSFICKVLSTDSGMDGGGACMDILDYSGSSTDVYRVIVQWIGCPEEEDFDRSDKRNT